MHGGWEDGGPGRTKSGLGDLCRRGAGFKYTQHIHGSVHRDSSVSYMQRKWDADGILDGVCFDQFGLSRMKWREVVNSLHEAAERTSELIVTTMKRAVIESI